MAISLNFLGGAGTVTGSRTLVEHAGRRILIDCGLFQGLKNLRLRNWARFPVPPESLSAVVLTHAHLDHSGYLPALVRDGYRGKIYCTSATRDLSEILLRDSAHLQEQDADFANRRGFSKHHPALPLYTEADAERALERLTTIDFHKPTKLIDGATIRFRHAGHILGSASVELDWGDRTIVFSGDIGRYGDPTMVDPEAIPQADYLVVESTYGDRTHDPEDPLDALDKIITRTIARGGTVVIPAFAVGRAQTLLYHLDRLKARGRLVVPVYLNSPMALDASEIYCRHPDDQKLSKATCERTFAVARYVRTVEESKQLNDDPHPKVIISASGMATGGRVLHHIARFAPDPRNTILFAGFQAAGTRGATLVAGAEAVKIHGVYVPVRAEVANLSMLSAHADANEIMRWLKDIKRPPQMTFVNHGEPAAADTLRRRIADEFGWTCRVPEPLEQIELT